MNQPFPARSLQGGVVGKLILIFGILFAVCALLWVVLLPRLVVSAIQSRTGFSVKVEKLSVNPFTTNVQIKGLVLTNPTDWPAPEFADLREFHAQAHLFSVFSDQVVADELVVDVAQLTLVRNKEGKLNATVFSDGLSGAPNGEAGQSKQKKTRQGFLIKHLVLKFDKLTFADYSGTSPSVKDYNINFNQEMHDVDSVSKLISPITRSFLTSDALGNLLSGKSSLMKDAAGMLQNAGKKTGDKIKGFLDSLDKKKP
jgi:hypothetical protein